MLKILCVCRGNLCRSPMAACVFEHLLTGAGMPARVRSAGASCWHVGDPADPLAVEALMARGYAPRPHAARRLTTDDLLWADRIFCVDDAVLGAVERLAPPGMAATPVQLSPEGPIADPYYDGAEAFAATLVRIEAAARGHVGGLLTRRAARPAVDVAATKPGEP
ncbi:MAG: low molecular weight protein-tyrosine-phosphatase [Pseudomonadota bacterium]